MDAAAVLAEMLQAAPRTDAGSQAELRVAAAAVVAWVDTFTECQAVEWFSFDPNWDPLR